MQWTMQTFPYKTVGSCQLQADVYRLPGREMQPALLWIHGGALIAGSRAWIARWQLERYLAAGFCLISVDYRLAPETRLPAIIEDLLDSLRWVREQGERLFAVDPQRIAVIGHSAGGYLALTAGFAASPRPKAVVSFYGYGDILDPWYSQPDPFYRRQGLVPPEQAAAAVGALPLAAADWNARLPFYLYCRQNGFWPREVGGKDPGEDPAWFSQFCPAQNVTRSYPPTLLIHGDQDTDVPYEQSVQMAAALQQHGVEHELMILQGKGHVFDGAPEAEQDPLVNGLFRQVIEFLGRV